MFSVTKRKVQPSIERYLTTKSAKVTKLPPRLQLKAKKGVFSSQASTESVAQPPPLQPSIPASQQYEEDDEDEGYFSGEDEEGEEGSQEGEGEETPPVVDGSNVPKNPPPTPTKAATGSQPAVPSVNPAIVVVEQTAPVQVSRPPVRKEVSQQQIPVIDLTVNENQNNVSLPPKPGNGKLGPLNKKTLSCINQLCDIASDKLQTEEERLAKAGNRPDFKAKNNIPIPGLNPIIGPTLTYEMNHKYYTLGKGACNNVVGDLTKKFQSNKDFTLGLSKVEALRLAVALLRSVQGMETHPIYHNFPW